LGPPFSVALPPSIPSHNLPFCLGYTLLVAATVPELGSLLFCFLFFSGPGGLILYSRYTHILRVLPRALCTPGFPPKEVPLDPFCFGPSGFFALTPSLSSLSCGLIHFSHFSKFFLFIVFFQRRLCPPKRPFSASSYRMSTAFNFFCI